MYRKQRNQNVKSIAKHFIKFSLRMIPTMQKTSTLPQSLLKTTGNYFAQKSTRT